MCDPGLDPGLGKKSFSLLLQNTLVGQLTRYE